MNKGKMITKNSLVYKSNFNLRGATLFLLLQSFLFSTTFYVDGGTAGNDSNNCLSIANPCLTIQAAINLALNNGDVVIVEGGIIYEENLLIETGITLKSADSSNPATIVGNNLDGGSNGSCIIVRTPSGSAMRISTTVEDMIITGGAGTLVNEDVDHDGNYTGPLDEQKTVGGGILIHNASFTSRRNNINNNGASGTNEGGGVYASGTGIDIDDENPDLPPQVFDTRSTIIFEETVFEDNTAQIGHTLMANAWEPEPEGRSIDITFPSSTFDVAYDSNDNDLDGVSEYWVSGKDNPGFDFSGDITGRYQAVTQNVWVDPVNGFDEGTLSGSFEEPFQTINYAMGMIYPTETNQITIFLSEGTFSPGSNGESFPIVLNSNIIISGQGEDVTTLNAEAHSENNTNVIQQGWDNYAMSISNLTISGGEDFFGGGIKFPGPGNLNLTNIIIRDNIAYFNGGGINFSGDNLLLSNVKIVGNNAGDEGGGIYSEGGSIITESGYVVISGNYASRGGGLYAHGLLSNMEITVNNAGIGGGIFIDGHETILINMTIANNIALEKNGVFCSGCFGDGKLKVVNSILRNGDSPVDNLAAEGMGGDINTVVFYSNIQSGMGDSWGGEFNISSDPLFVNEASGDYFLSADSPCIDSGTNDIDNIQLWEDLYGNSWYEIGDGIVDIEVEDGEPDMGAYEWYPEYEPGDVSMDGSINILDIVQLINFVLGNQEYTTEQGELADLNGDGSLNILDVVQLVNIVLNQE